jgi:hypothetical protein
MTEAHILRGIADLMSGIRPEMLMPLKIAAARGQARISGISRDGIMTIA